MNLASNRHNCRCERRTNSSIFNTVPPDFDLSKFLEIIIGLHLAVEASVINCAITDVVAADRNIKDKVAGAIKSKVHKFNIVLLVAGGRCHRHLVVDAHRVACVAGQLRQDIHDMIVASGGSRVQARDCLADRT